MRLPVEARAVIVGAVALLIYLIVSGTNALYGVILAGLFMLMYVALLGLERIARRE